MYRKRNLCEENLNYLFFMFELNIMAIKYFVLCATAAETRFSVTAESKAMLYIPLQRNTSSSSNNVGTVLTKSCTYGHTKEYNVEIELRMRIIVLQRNAIYFLFFFFSLLLCIAERNLFLILLTSSSYSVGTDYYTRPIKSKWPGLVANLRPLRTTSAANNYNRC